MHIEPQPARFTAESIPGGIRASVPARRNWLILLFLSAWFVAWIFGEAHAIRVLTSPSENADRMFMLVWLVGWTIGGGFAAATILWQLGGKEIISISPTLFEYRVEAFGLGRTRSYKKTEVKNLRATDYSTNPLTNQTAMLPPFAGAGYGPVAFDYGARTFRMAPALEEAEARLLVEKLSPHLARTL